MNVRVLIPVLFLLALLPISRSLAKERSWMEAKSAMFRGLRDKDAQKRAMSVYEIDGFDTPEAARAVAKYVLGRDDRAPVIRAGLQLASALKAEKSIATLVAEADDGKVLKRARVIEALGYVPGEVALGAVLKGAYDPDPRVRASAVLALEEHRSGRSDMAAMDALAAKEWPVRAAAMQVIRRMKPKAAAAPLVDLIAPDAEIGRLRLDALEALRRVTGQDFGYDHKSWKAWLASPEIDGPRNPNPLTWRASLGGVETPARRVLYVLQVSQTMNGEVQIDPMKSIPADVRKAGGPLLATWSAARTKLDLAQLWIAWSIDHLARDAEFNVLTYSTGVNTVFPEFARATAENRKKAKKRILSLSGSAQSDFYAALRRLFTLVSKDPLDEKNLLEGPETVFFLADGSADWGEIRSASAVLGEAERWNRYRQIRFDVFGMGEHNTRLLSDLAGLGPGGEYVTLP